MLRCFSVINDKILTRTCRTQGEVTLFLVNNARWQVVLELEVKIQAGDVEILQLNLKYFQPWQYC